MKDYCLPTGLTDKELDELIERSTKESYELADWPEVDEIYDDE